MLKSADFLDRCSLMGGGRIWRFECIRFVVNIAFRRYELSELKVANVPFTKRPGGRKQ